LFYLPTVGNRRKIEAGVAGMRGDLYQRMLREVLDQVRLADGLGYDSRSFTEHRRSSGPSSAPRAASAGAPRRV